MKRIQLIIAIIFSLSVSSQAQNNNKIGAGYFGKTLTYPGVVLEFESEKTFTEKASLPLRIDLGFYTHPRYNTGAFLEVNYGFRRYFNSGIFLEESIGVGVLGTALSTDGAFELDDQGQVEEVSKINKPDLMPSLTLGIGYAIEKDGVKSTLIWLRPKMFWQYPHKTTSTYNLALQVGFTHKIN